MTVSSTTIKTSPYACDGATTQFAFTWSVWDSSEVKVILRTVASGAETTLTETTHYTVTLSTSTPSAGYITTVDTYSALYEIVIKANFPNTQEIDYGEGDTFPAESHEEALDRGVRIVQQLNEQLSRALLWPESSILENVELPEISASVVEHVLQVNNDGTAVEWGEFTESASLTTHDGLALDAVHTAMMIGHNAASDEHAGLFNQWVAQMNTVSSGLALVASSPEVAAGSEATKTVSPSSIGAIWGYETIQISAGSFRPSETVAGTQDTQEYLDSNLGSGTMRDYVEFIGTNGASDIVTEMYDVTLLLPETWDQATLKARAWVMPTWDQAVTAGSDVEIGFFIKAYNDASDIGTQWSEPNFVSVTLDNAGTCYEYVTPASANIASAITGSNNRIDLAVGRRTLATNTEKYPIWLTHVQVQFKRTNLASAW